MNIPDLFRHTRFRFVEEGDAEFILALRLNPNKNRFVSPVDDDIGAQRQWIRDYKMREAQGSEYYFVTMNRHGVAQGIHRLYHIDAESYHAGSTVMKPGAERYAGLESILFGLEFGFYTLGKTRQFSENMKANRTVSDVTLRLGARLIGEDDAQYFYEFLVEPYERVRPRYQRLFLDDPAP